MWILIDLKVILKDEEDSIYENVSSIVLIELTTTYVYKALL